MEDILEYIFVTMLVFTCVVAPVWVVMHYTTKRKMRGQLDASEQDELELLIHTAEKMEDRIDTLEAILDVETPDWRKRHKESLG